MAKKPDFWAARGRILAAGEKAKGVTTEDDTVLSILGDVKALGVQLQGITMPAVSDVTPVLKTCLNDLRALPAESRPAGIIDELDGARILLEPPE